MKRSNNLDDEHQLTCDLWLLLSNAEQLVVNHENLHSRMYKHIHKCLNYVEAYQNAIEFMLEKQNQPED